MQKPLVGRGLHTIDHHEDEHNMRYSGGFFKGNRSAILNDFDAMTYGLYFILSAWAAIRDSKDCKTLQVLTSSSELAVKLKIRENTIKKKLRILEAADLISQQIINGKGRIITLQAHQYGMGCPSKRMGVPIKTDGGEPINMDPLIKNKSNKELKKREKALSLELAQFISRYQELYTKAYLFKSGLKDSDMEIAEDVIRMVGFEAAYGALPYYFESKRQFYTDQRNALRIFWNDIDIFTSRWARDKHKLGYGQTQMPTETSC